MQALGTAHPTPGTGHQPHRYRLGRGIDTDAGTGSDTEGVAELPHLAGAAIHVFCLRADRPGIYWGQDMLRKTLVFFCACVVGLLPCLGGQKAEDAAQLLRQGQDLLYRLDYDGAEAVCRRMIQQAPDDPAGYGMLSSVYWNDLLTKTGNLVLDDYATPTPFSEGKTGKLNLPVVIEAQKRFHQANDTLLEICKKRLAKDEKDVRALYFSGMYHENLAAEMVAITKQHMRAINPGNEAKKIHEQVLKLDPDFIDANVSIASHEFASATLPWSLKWIAFIIGYRGDKKKALEKFELVAAKGTYRRLDAEVLLGLLHSWKGEPTRAVIKFRGLRIRYPENYLLDINLAAILEKKLNETQAAAEVYGELLKNPKSKAWTVCPAEIHYRTGKMWLRIGDSALALEQFEKSVQTQMKVERETEPLAYYSMAQIYEQRGDKKRALECYRNVLQYQGSELNSELKQARRKVQ